MGKRVEAGGLCAWLPRLLLGRQGVSLRPTQSEEGQTPPYVLPVSHGFPKPKPSADEKAENGVFLRTRESTVPSFPTPKNRWFGAYLQGSTYDVPMERADEAGHVVSQLNRC